ncbi:MAG: alpha,alpha-trehalose-phosphate synthase (UDP-forming) [Actinomycetota bacterium]
MTEDISVVLASNRGPVSFVQTEDGFTTKGAAGGASPALDAVARRLGDRAEWIAAPVSDADRAAIAAGLGETLSDRLGYPFYFIDIDAETFHRYYNDVSNRMLWFANHCLWDEMELDRFGDEELDAWDNAYEPVNRRFAKKIAETAAEDALVLFQDYHLATAPGHLRALRPELASMHFTHSSFCGPHGLDRLPRPIPKTVIEGMLGADLVGFHVPPWVEGFYACCESAGAKVDRAAGLVEHDGRSSWVRAYPIPIDSANLRERALGDRSSEWAGRFRAWAGEGRLIVRGDRAEPSKNIVRGFEAFEALLDRRPDLAGAVRFAACLYPSRQDMPEYQRYTELIEATVRRVNERHPGSVELYMQDDFDRTLGAYRTYDVLLVNSIMDGMNLVSKEGPALNERDGALVLSRGAGSFSELGDDAVPIEDPLDIDETSRALEAALDLPSDERVRRARDLKQRAEAAKPGDWINAQIEDLAAIRSDGEPRSAPARTH